MAGSRLSVTEAVLQRQSIRAFLPRAVEGAVVREILQLAQRAPSGGNLQPWQVVALAGAPQQALMDEVARKLDAGEREAAQYAVYPPGLWEPLRSRRQEAGTQRYDALGLTREQNGQQELERRNYRFFGAPVGLFFFLDRRVGPPQWSDVGMFMQTLMLLAVERGLATCPQEVWSNWPETVARHCDAASTLQLFAGMSLGYADTSSPMNGYRTGRAAAPEWLTLKGLEG